MCPTDRNTLLTVGTGFTFFTEVTSTVNANLPILAFTVSRAFFRHAVVFITDLLR